MRKLQFFILLVAASVIWSCQGIQHNLSKKQQGIELKEVAVDELNPTIFVAAHAAAEISTRKDLSSFPMAVMDPRAQIHSSSYQDLSTFLFRSAVITDYIQNQDGSNSLDLVMEFLDPSFFRRYYLATTITFGIQNVDKKKTSAIKKWIISNADLFNERAKSDENFRLYLTKLQMKSGLKPTGMIDRKTSEILSTSMPVIRITKLKTAPIYPERPSHLLYILPLEKVAKAPQKFSQGFGSIREVAKNAIPKGKFVLSPGKSFVLFVFVLDMVDPAASMQVGFSGAPSGRSEFMTPKRYAVPGKWPVLVEGFKIDELKDFSGSLYVNLFVNDKVAGSYKLY